MSNVNNTRDGADWNRFYPIAIVIAGAIAYVNSFSAPFIFDDLYHIVENATLHAGQLKHIFRTRGIVYLTFLLNYKISALDVVPYHIVNLLIHLSAALLLYAIIRRTLQLPSLTRRYGNAASALALAVSAIWTVHPLLTQSVTYITQRAEILTGLFYLLTIYCVARGGTSTSRWPWYIAAIASSVLGMGCKASMVTIPVTVLAYNRIFLASSFREEFRKRWGLYAGLVATWGLLAAIIIAGGKPGSITAGFQYEGSTPFTYLLTQTAVIAHYLRLALFPHPLCFDYFWPTAESLHEVLPQALFIVSLGLTTLWALIRRPHLGFVGLWFFITLAPTSSVMPIADNAAEHRMYLPLIAAVVALVVAAYEALRRATRHQARPDEKLGLSGMGLLILLTTILTAATIQRNSDYASNESLWADTVTRSPLNPRAYFNLGVEIAKNGRVEKAIPHFEKALELVPHYADALDGLGLALIDTGTINEGLAHCRQAMELASGVNSRVRALFHIAYGVEKQGELEEAIKSYKKILKMRDPWPRPSERAQAHCGIADICQQLGQTNNVIQHFNEAIRILPSYAPAYLGLGMVLFGTGQTESGVEHLRVATTLRPDYAIAHLHLGNALTQLGKIGPAADAYKTAVELQPDLAGRAHYGLGIGCLLSGQTGKAAEFLEEALRLDPGLEEAKTVLEKIRTKTK